MAQGGPHQEAMAISLSGETFTVEAMEIAKTEGCDVVAVHEFFWTDASYAAIRQIISSDRKRQWPLGSLSIECQRRVRDLAESRRPGCVGQRTTGTFRN
jgi:hypothetical protein